MRRYGGGMLYAALPLHMQRGCFRIRTHDQQVTKAQLYRCTRVLKNNNSNTCPNIVQGPASGTRRTRINSASFTILSARKYFKKSANSSADLNCDIDDTVNGVDKPVPRCRKVQK